MSAQKVYLITGGPKADVAQLESDFASALKICKKDKPKVSYIGTASLDSKPFFNFMKKHMLKGGAGEVCLAPIAGENADIALAKEIIDGSDIVFMSGGEVEDGMIWLEKSGLDKYLTELFYGGKPFFGLSAGCIMMGKNWTHWDIENDDSSASIFDCLGFIPMVFDAHAEEEDWKELKCTIKLMGEGAEGYGLSDGGAYIADDKGYFESLRTPAAAFVVKNGAAIRK